MSGMVYFLMETEIREINENDRTIIARQSLPDTSPSDEEFQRWVAQSINSASKNHFDRLFTENVLAAQLNASFLCNNRFNSEVLSLNVNTKESVETFTASQIFNLDLPFIDKIDVDRLMFVRESESDVFTSFRIELEKHFRDLRMVTDEKELQVRTENIFHELNDVQCHKIKMKMSSIYKKLGSNALLAIGGLMGSVQTGGLSLLGVAMAIAQGYKDFKEYREQVVENPSYFLWKVKK